MKNKKIYIVQDGTIVDSSTKEKFLKCLNALDITTNQNGEFYNFVGFIIYKENILVSFPKHFLSVEQREELEQNIPKLNEYMKLLFRCILKSSNNKSEQYIGIKKDLNSAYPFQQFFNIYNYYRNYGLFTNNRQIKYFGYSGKISWKDTIRKSPIVINQGNILYLPMVIKNSIEEYVFISKCMAYVIDSTLDQFSLILEGSRTQLDTRDIDFSNKFLIISLLRKAKSSMFKDIHRSLVDNLISYFENVEHEGGPYEIKIYTFNLVWERMVESYLQNNFERVNKNSELEFSDDTQYKPFSKKIIYPDIRRENGYRLEPDHYLVIGNERYIFDAKYYQREKELNYKQIAYYFLLKHFEAKRNDSGELTEVLKTHNAIIIPTEKAKYSSRHFELNPQFNEDEESFLIITQYLNTIEVMQSYIKNTNT